MYGIKRVALNSLLFFLQKGTVQDSATTGIKRDKLRKWKLYAKRRHIYFD